MIALSSVLQGRSLEPPPTGFPNAAQPAKRPDRQAKPSRLNMLLWKARPHVARYVVAATFVIVCLGIRLYLNDYFVYKYFATGFFYPAVVLAAYFLGFGPALFAAVLSVLAIRYWFMRPVGELFVLPIGWNPLRLTFFMFGSTTLAFLISQLQASKRRAAVLASELLESQGRLLREQELLRRLIAHTEAEKQLLCNDFHDGLIQHVVGSKMLLEARLDNVPTADPLHDIVHHLGKGIADGRRVIRGVRPSVLDEPGLLGPLHELVEQFSAVGFEVDVDCCPGCDESDVPDAIRTAPFRICQEALANSWKHSGCNRATVHIEKQGDWLHVEIDDDGRGIDAYPKVATKGFGLQGMDARARLLGGEVHVVDKGHGTCVRARLPLAVEPIACGAR